MHTRFRTFVIGVAVCVALQTALAVGSAAAFNDPALCPADAAGSEVRFAVVGDYGIEGQPVAEVADQVKSWEPDLIVTVGDNNYPAGSAETMEANLGQYYHEFICGYSGPSGTGSSTSRFLPSLGNHDWDTDGAQPYLDFFDLPGNERYYDFVRGPVHFFMLDSDPREPDGIEVSAVQAGWLKAALAASVSPWDIVLLHRAPFSSASVHGSQAAMQWPYEQWGADAVIAGHDHTYERILFGEFPYFVDGLGGAVRYGFVSPPVEGSQVRYSADHGAMLVEATRTEIEFRFITRDGALIDSYALQKPLAGPVPAEFYFHQVTAAVINGVQVTHAGDGSGRLFIVQQGRTISGNVQDGSIRVFKNGALLEPPFLDLSGDLKAGGEQGLLALAFHPNYESNGKFYVAYTAPLNNDPGSILTLRAFTVSDPGEDVADISTNDVLLTIQHPEHSNHNGGTLAFGPDGYLYWSVGDGGGSGDPDDNAEDLSSLLGKVLRLDVDAAAPYIPVSNPFLETPTDDPATLAEIWAYGLRNPWRMAFDSVTGDLYIGDVGQNAWEEVDFQPASITDGKNYGWNMFEAETCYDNTPPCDGADKEFPVAWYPHTDGCSITGGHVYRGADYPSMYGYYFYGDFCSGRIWSLRYNESSMLWENQQVADTTFSISSFGEDESGNVYVLDRAGGKVYLMVYMEPATFPGVTPMPAQGTQACLQPHVGVSLRLTDLVRNASGGLDPATIKLTLDNVDQTAAAKITQSNSSPVGRATILYTANLNAGNHTARFEYPSPIGTLTRTWTFSVTGAVTCPTSTSAEAPLTENIEAQIVDTSSAAPSPEVATAAEPPDARAGIGLGRRMQLIR